MGGGSSALPRDRPWTPAEVSEVVRSIAPKFAPYAKAFLDHGIDGESLLSFSIEKLNEYGIVVKGIHRDRLLRELNNIRNINSAILERGKATARVTHDPSSDKLSSRPIIESTVSGGKFNTLPQYFVFGNDQDFQDGLTKKVKQLTKSMECECITTEKGIWAKAYTYVTKEAAVEREDGPHRVRDLGHGGLKLDDFCRHEKAVEAKLTVAEVAALRMYTGPMYEPWNRALRMYATDPSQLADWATCISVLYSAIFKLSFLSKKATVYRGVNETAVKLPESFLDASSDAFAGGVELAFMSTTTDPRVAIEYAMRGAEACGTLFEIQFDAASRGADVQWVSQYPYEAELLYPPCTYLTCESVSIVSVASLVGNATAMAHIGGDIRCVSVRAAVSTARTDVGSITTCEVWPGESGSAAYQSAALHRKWRKGVTYIGRIPEEGELSFTKYIPYNRPAQRDDAEVPTGQRKWTVHFRSWKVARAISEGDYMMLRGLPEMHGTNPNGVWFKCIKTELIGKEVTLLGLDLHYSSVDIDLLSCSAMFCVMKEKDFTVIDQQRNDAICAERLRVHAEELRAQRTLFESTAGTFIDRWNIGLTNLVGVGHGHFRVYFDPTIVPVRVVFGKGDYVQIKHAPHAAGCDVNGLWFVVSLVEGNEVLCENPGFHSSVNATMAMFMVKKAGALSAQMLAENEASMAERAKAWKFNFPNARRR